MHATQISTWKQRLLEVAVDLFEDRRRKQCVPKRTTKRSFLSRSAV